MLSSSGVDQLGPLIQKFNATVANITLPQELRDDWKAHTDSLMSKTVQRPYKVAIVGRTGASRRYVCTKHLMLKLFEGVSIIGLRLRFAWTDRIQVGKSTLLNALLHNQVLTASASVRDYLIVATCTNDYRELVLRLRPRSRIRVGCAES
jgi:hypothetical protein